MKQLQSATFRGFDDELNAGEELGSGGGLGKVPQTFGMFNDDLKISDCGMKIWFGYDRVV